MKKILLLSLIFLQTFMFAQTTPSYKNVKLTQLPLGNFCDSVVLTNGSTKLLKYIPVSQIKIPTNLTFTATPTGGTVFSSNGTDAVLPLATNINSGLLSPADKINIDGVQTQLNNKVSLTGDEGISGIKFFNDGLKTDSDIEINGGGNLIINQGTYKTNINSAPVTANRGIDFPDKSGILGLNEDIILKAPINNPTFTGSVVVPNATLSTQAVNKSQLDAVVAKTYRTYFVNSITGNNSTGAYENPNLPYATIDYVLSLPFVSGTVIYLQNEGGIFPMNGKFPVGATKITSDVSVTLDFSANVIGNLFSSTAGHTNFVDITLKHGLLKNDKAGGANGCTWFEENVRSYMNVDVKELYIDTNSTWFYTMGLALKAQKISSRVSVLSADVLSYSGSTMIYDVSHFVCLGNNATFLTDGLDAIVRIAEITGTGSYYFPPNVRTEVGNIRTTNSCSLYQNSIVHFNNSIITSVNGLNVANEENGNAYNVFISGNIRSCPKIIGGGYVNNIFLKFTNFSADFGIGSLNVGNGNIIFENCSIKSNGSLINIPSYVTNAKITLKNSTFEMVTPAPLITATAGANTHTITLGNISTNATVINNQIGSGVTLIQLTNY